MQRKVEVNLSEAHFDVCGILPSRHPSLTTINGTVPSAVAYLSGVYPHGGTIQVPTIPITKSLFGFPAESGVLESNTPPPLGPDSQQDAPVTPESQTREHAACR